MLEEIIGSAVIKYHKTPGSLPVHVDISDQILIVSADAVLLEQVLLNLFDNVSSHGEHATKIWLHIRVEKENVILSVEDDGVGIPSALFDQVLDGTVHLIRKQADSSRNMGIGLSVCRTIIMSHGGNLQIKKSPHGGAAIEFNLPCKEDLP
ncbi:MAG: GHKL domain-containing protein [Clostridia bacterium]|nr:GHKL domain-containing protein [Clostridia bacterium]